VKLNRKIASVRCNGLYDVNAEKNG